MPNENIFSINGDATELKYTIWMEPVAKGRPRFTRQGHVFTPKETRAATSRLQAAISFLNGGHNTRRINKPFGVILTATYVCTRPKSLSAKKYPSRTLKTTKPDIDNYTKLLMDAMNDAGLWDDDSQVVGCHTTKFYAAPEEAPHYEFSLKIVDRF